MQRISHSHVPHAIVIDGTVTITRAHYLRIAWPGQSKHIMLKTAPVVARAACWFSAAPCEGCLRISHDWRRRVPMQLREAYLSVINSSWHHQQTSNCMLPEKSSSLWTALLRAGLCNLQSLSQRFSGHKSHHTTLRKTGMIDSGIMAGRAVLTQSIRVLVQSLFSVCHN